MQSTDHSQIPTVDRFFYFIAQKASDWESFVEIRRQIVVVSCRAADARTNGKHRMRCRMKRCQLADWQIRQVFQYFETCDCVQI